MDLGVHKGTSDPDVNLLNAEKSSSEYVIQRLVETNNFVVKDRTLILAALEKLNMLGLIDPDTAKKIGEIIGVRYIIYGNVTDVSVDVEKALATVNTVKAHLIIRIMDIETGTSSSTNAEISFNPFRNAANRIIPRQTNIVQERNYHDA